MSALEAGKLFERYRIIRQLGSGISGESYEAEDIILLRKVTLKLIHPWSALTDAARRQFFREMQGISILNHPYLASILDYGEVNGKLYVARRYVSSGSLLGNDGRLWYRPPLSISDAIYYGHQLAQALEYIHKHGYLHGSLGFANILVLRGPYSDNEAGPAPFLLADVGLANFVRRFGEPQVTLLPITAAPEQLGQRVTQASDQFALAVLIYFWLAGRPPYLGTPEEIEEQKLTETIPALYSLNPKASIEQDVVLRRALSVYPEERYPSALAFANALLATLAAQSQTASEASSTMQQTTDIPQAESHEALDEVQATPTAEPESSQPAETTSIAELESAMQTESIATESDESERESERDTQPEFAPEAISENGIEAGEDETQSRIVRPETDIEHEPVAELTEDAPELQQGSDSVPQPTPDVPQPTPDPVPQPVPDVPQPLPTPDVPQPTPDPVPQPAPDPIPQPEPDVPSTVPDPVPQVVPDVPQPLPEPDAPPFTPEPSAQSEQLAEEELPISQETVSSAQDQEPTVSEQEQEAAPQLEDPETVPLTRLVIMSPYAEEPYEVVLERDETTIGRAGSSDVLLDHDNSTSRHHALLRREGDHYVLYDQRSANGVFVNGQMLMGEMGYVLEDGDHISIGNYELIFRCKRPEVAEEAEETTSESETVTSWSFF